MNHLWGHTQTNRPLKQFCTHNNCLIWSHEVWRVTNKFKLFLCDLSQPPCLECLPHLHLMSDFKGSTCTWPCEPFSAHHHVTIVSMLIMLNLSARVNTLNQVPIHALFLLKIRSIQKRIFSCYMLHQQHQTVLNFFLFFFFYNLLWNHSCVHSTKVQVDFNLMTCHYHPHPHHLNPA